MNEPGLQAQQLARDVGRWDVVATLRPSPGATPIITRGLVAERNLVGLYLHETLRPDGDSKEPPFERDDYLTYSRVEGRWHYVSLDTRFPVGIMPAYSFDAGTERKLELQFTPIAFVGMGAPVEGRMLRSNLVVIREGPDHQRKEQYAVAATGDGKPWLFVEYDYRRRR